MAPQLLELSAESALFDLLDQVQDIKPLCFTCRDEEIQKARAYITNTSTRAKVLILCSEHIEATLGLFNTFQDSTKQHGSMITFDVTPRAGIDNSSKRIISIPLTIKGKIVRLLIATDKDIDAPNVPDVIRAAEESRAQQTSTAAGNIITTSGAVWNIEEAFARVGESKGQKLKIADQSLLLQSGLAQMDDALQALETAHANLKVVLPGAFSDRMSKNIRVHTYRLLRPVRAIGRLVKGDGDQDRCKEADKIVDEEMMPYITKHTEFGLQPHQIDSMRVWFNSLEPRVPEG